MPTELELLIIGAGGHGRVVADAACQQGAWARVAATDRDPARTSGMLLAGVPLVAPEPALSRAARIHVAIGDARSRRAEADAAGTQRLATITHPLAAISPHAVVGAGCFVAAQAVVAPGAQLGVGVIVNHGAVVDHDAVVGDFCHVAPLAAIGGGVQLGLGVLIGTGARVLPGLRVCAGAVIGAGAVVHRDVGVPGTYVGVPARRVR